MRRTGMREHDEALALHGNFVLLNRRLRRKIAGSIDSSSFPAFSSVLAAS